MMSWSAFLWAWSWKQSFLQRFDFFIDERSTCSLAARRRRRAPTEKLFFLLLQINQLDSHCQAKSIPGKYVPPAKVYQEGERNYRDTCLCHSIFLYFFLACFSIPCFMLYYTAYLLQHFYVIFKLYTKWMCKPQALWYITKLGQHRVRKCQLCAVALP